MATDKATPAHTPVSTKTVGRVPKCTYITFEIFYNAIYKHIVENPEGSDCN